jgi:hypothetical protein
MGDQINSTLVGAAQAVGFLHIVDIALNICRCFRGTNSAYFIQVLSMLKMGYNDGNPVVGNFTHPPKKTLTL